MRIEELGGGELRVSVSIQASKSRRMDGVPGNRRSFDSPSLRSRSLRMTDSMRGGFSICVARERSERQWESPSI